MVKLMEHIISSLGHTDPLDAAVASCFSTIFYSVAHTGEFILPTLNNFNPTQHIMPSDISKWKDHNNLEVTVFHIPKTKCTSEGEDVFGHTKVSLTLRPYSIITLKSMILLPMVLFLHTSMPGINVDGPGIVV